MKTKQTRLPEDPSQSLASLIRQKSRAGRLITDDAILHLLREQKDRPLQAEEFGSLLRNTMEQNGDLNELVSADGSRHYYSSKFMTSAYASLLLRKQGNPLLLMAQIIRQHSAEYPRPVPLDLFTQTPFNFSREEVQGILERMTAREEFRDIAQTTTSAFRVFLYSTRYLEPAHASMLAEWLDTGQSENP